MRGARAGALAALTAAGATGCYAVAIAVPPLRASATVGAAAGHIAAPLRGRDYEPPRVEDHAQEAITELRGSINPLQLIAPRARPPVDVGVGYGARFFFPGGYAPYVYHGPYLELGAFPWLWRMDAVGTEARFYLNAAAGLSMVDLNGTLASGTSVRVAGTFEVAPFARGGAAGTTELNAGAWGARGEYNIAVEMALGWEHVGSAEFYTATLGITFRLPGAAAAAAGSVFDLRRIR